MIRICSSLVKAGYEVTLIGAKWQHSVPLKTQPFQQVRLNTWFFGWGKLYYAEYNLRLFFYLLFKKCDIICGIDLDTIIPAFLVAKLKNKIFVFDAHEYFTELEEVVNRPFTQKVWKVIDEFFTPKVKYAYTVNHSLAELFEKKYGVKFEVISNIPPLKKINIPEKKEKYILYQGWVNYGRGLVPLVNAMKEVDCNLYICGKGNYFEQLVKYVSEMNLNEKIIFKSFVEPSELQQITLNATIGITLFENKGLSNYYSLANRFFDYIHSGIPQIAINFPEYQRFNNEFEVSFLVNDLSPKTLSSALNRLLNDEQHYSRLQQNCLKAREKYNWENEEKKLIDFYSRIVC